MYDALMLETQHIRDRQCVLVNVSMELHILFVVSWHDILNALRCYRIYILYT